MTEDFAEGGHEALVAGDGKFNAAVVDDAVEETVGVVPGVAVTVEGRSGEGTIVVADVPVGLTFAVDAVAAGAVFGEDDFALGDGGGLGGWGRGCGGVAVRRRGAGDEGCGGEDEGCDGEEGVVHGVKAYAVIKGRITLISIFPHRGGRGLFALDRGFSKDRIAEERFGLGGVDALVEA